MKKDKEWAKEQLEYYIEAVGNPFNDLTHNMINAYKNVEHIINQLDEPTEAEPLVVPRSLGELLVSIPLGEKTMLIPMIEDLRKFWSETFERDRQDLYYFIADNTKQLIEVILGNRGYEVEKEKLYYALNKHGETLLLFYGGKVCVSSGYEIHDDNKGLYQLTEKQIKDYDERYWHFTVGVTE